MSITSRPRRVPVALLAAGGLALSIPLAGCLDGDGDEVTLLDAELPAEVRLDGRAPWFGAFEYGAGWDEDELEVCWDASAYGADTTEEWTFAEARELIRQIVLDEWGRAGRIRFTSIWPSCDAPIDHPDIRIGHVGGAPGWSSFGTDARDIPTGPTMAINLHGPTSAGCVSTGGIPPIGGGAIAACNGTWLAGDPDSMEVWHEALTLHLFGYALGLRKEDTHPDNTCFHDEEPDGYGHDGEPLWSFDSTSIMSSCKLQHAAYESTTRPTLSVKDIRSLNTLYPTGVRLSTGVHLTGTPQWFGPGYYTRATTPALASVNSIVVPPGYRVTLCNTTSCYLYTESRRTMPSYLATSIQNMSIALASTVARDPGYIGPSQTLLPGTYLAADGQLAAVGNNAISSAWMPPGHAITLCDEAPGTSGNTCVSSVGGVVGWPTLVKFFSIFGPSLDDRASYVKVQPRVVTYATTDMRGATYSLATGVYKVSSGSTYLSGIRTVAVPPGLEAVACDSESTFGFPRPTCQTFVQSGQVNASLLGKIKRLEVRVPMVIAR